MEQYTITVTQGQARLIMHALNLVSHIQTGQWAEFINWLPQQDLFSRRKLCEQLLPLMKEHFRNARPEGAYGVIDGCGSRYAIDSEYVPDTARIARDLEQAIERQLSSNRNPEVGFYR